VLYRLRDAGFMAFLVGGCVRDLLIGIEPKDFDVATDALPEQVRKLFRNCRLVGRRFRLAHVFFGREIIEVATFRAATAPAPGGEPLPDADVAVGEDGDPEQEGLHASGAELASLDDSEASLDGTESAPSRASGRIGSVLHPQRHPAHQTWMSAASLLEHDALPPRRAYRSNAP
jgi:hypothetical protein